MYIQKYLGVVFKTRIVAQVHVIMHSVIKINVLSALQVSVWCQVKYQKASIDFLRSALLKHSEAMHTPLPVPDPSLSMFDRLVLMNIVHAPSVPQRHSVLPSCSHV